MYNKIFTIASSKKCQINMSFMYTLSFISYLSITQAVSGFMARRTPWNGSLSTFLDTSGGRRIRRNNPVVSYASDILSLSILEEKVLKLHSYEVQPAFNRKRQCLHMTTNIAAAATAIENTGATITTGESNSIIARTCSTADNHDDIKHIIENKFTSKPMQVYIEDTDAFGVVFNGNYLKFYERILHNHYDNYSHQYSTNSRHDDDERNNNSNNGANFNNMMITYVTKHNFKSAARLGDEFIIQGEMIEDRQKDNGVCEQTWNLQMIKYIEKYQLHDDDENNDGKSVVFNTATITLSNSYIMRPSDDKNTNHHESSSLSDLKSKQHTASKANEVMNVEASFPTHLDEFSPLLINVDDEDSDDEKATIMIKYHLPFHTILRYFERIRSDALGGPASLNRMQVEYGILWVVSSIDDFSLSQDIMNDKIQNQILCQDVIVKSKFTLKRGGMLITCDQELYTETKGKVPIKLSTASITICAVDVNNGYRPTRNIPDFVRELWNP